MDVISLYEDAARDISNHDENGYLSYEMFNRMLQIASNRTLDYLTGDESNRTLPISYSTQKAKDFLGFLITKFPTPINNGIITKPADYYMYENLYILSLANDNSCEIDDSNCNSDSVQPEIIETPVEMLDGQQFNVRAQTYIKGLKPSPQKPICKVIGETLEFKPKELGSCVLEYIRYPIAGLIKTTIDPTYNDIVADPLTSLNSEWGEWARQLITYFIAIQFSVHVRENALFQMANVVEKSKP